MRRSIVIRAITKALMLIVSPGTLLSYRAYRTRKHSTPAARSNTIKLPLRFGIDRLA